MKKIERKKGKKKRKTRASVIHRINIKQGDTHRLPWGSAGEEPPAVQETRLNPRVVKIPWRRKPLQHSCPENPMDRGAWWATVHGAAESDMTE